MIRLLFPLLVSLVIRLILAPLSTLFPLTKKWGRRGRVEINLITIDPQFELFQQVQLVGCNHAGLHEEEFLLY
jgi:hypothetical protein